MGVGLEPGDDRSTDTFYKWLFGLEASSDIMALTLRQALEG